MVSTRWKFTLLSCSVRFVADLPTDCSEVFNRGQRKSGVYPIKPNQSEPFDVYCEISSGKRENTFQPPKVGVVFFTAAGLHMVLNSKSKQLQFRLSFLELKNKPATQKLIKFSFKNLFTSFLKLLAFAERAATVIQQRVDGTVDFDQTWDIYELGFGNLESK